MKKLVLALSLISCFSCAQALEVKVHEVNIPQYLNVPYEGKTEVFKDGLPMGFGSALAFKSLNEDGSVEFYALTDRGPNGDAPKYEKDGKLYAGKFFFSKSFVPSIALLKLHNNDVSIEKVIHLKNEDGTNVSGLPINAGKIGTTSEIALDGDLNVLPFDDNGLDPEGIALDAQGNFWISDEYGPFAMQFDADGKMQKRLYPGKGLPEIFKYRTPNRGAEGLTITPDGTIVVMEQSILNLKKDGKSSAKTASFCRIAFVNPKTGEFKTFGYPIDVDAYKKPGDAKLGDLVAINDHEFLIIEQGKNAQKEMRNLVYKFDISTADDITDAKKDNLEPEFYKDPSFVKLATKELVLDLRKVGWKADKAEGLTILPDNQTIAVINDNDFGVAVKFKDKQNPKAKITDYVIHKDKSITFNGKKVNPELKFVQNSQTERQINLFMITLDSKLN